MPINLLVDTTWK